MTARLCILPGMSEVTESRLYRIWRRGTIVGVPALVEIADQFRCVANDLSSADEEAVRNLIDHSAHHWGEYVLTFDGAQIAYADDGVGTLLVPLEDIQADACHAGPTIVPHTQVADEAAA